MTSWRRHCHRQPLVSATSQRCMLLPAALCSRRTTDCWTIELSPSSAACVIVTAVTGFTFLCSSCLVNFILCYCVITALCCTVMPDHMHIDMVILTQSQLLVNQKYTYAICRTWRNSELICYKKLFLLIVIHMRN